MLDIITLLVLLIISTTIGQNGDGPLPIESIRVQKCRSYAVTQLSSKELSLAEEYPNVAQIGYMGLNCTLWQCQGSLISSRYILSVAHCLISDYYGPPIKVRMGILSPEPIERNIDKIYVHPDYINHSLLNDIGLIKMSKPIIFTEFIRPTCLPESEVTSNLYYRLNYRFKNYEHDFVPRLELHKLKSIDKIWCTQYFRSIFSLRKISEEFYDICARETTYMDGACGGYSGAPLLALHPDAPFIKIQVGITIYGRRCNYRNPEGYVRVFKFVEWIEGIVWSLGEDE